MATACAASAQQESLKMLIKRDFSTHYRTVKDLHIRKLIMQGQHQNTEHKVQVKTIGYKIENPTIIILVVGATGSGKTTLINAMINHIYNVDFDDDFRLILLENEDAPKRSEADSQTDYITAYTFYHMPGMPFQYNYILIDTPGFGDTRGIERDQKMMIQLKAFFEQDNGIDQINGVGFVTPASASRLTHTQRYVYDGICSMFGKDIKNKIHVMATFADASPPPVLDAITKAGLHYVKLHKFNNSALGICNENTGDGQDSNADENDDDEDDDDSASIQKLYWDIGRKNMKNFFNMIGYTDPVSLTLTKEVLDERLRLQITIGGLQTQIHIGLHKLDALKKERQMLADFGDNKKANEDHTVEEDVPYFVKHNLEKGKFVTNCSKCNFTCHYPCAFKDDKDKVHCSAMTKKYCRVCTGKCWWEVHNNTDFKIEWKTKKERRTLKEVLARYNIALQGIKDKEKAVKSIEDDINQHARHLINQIQEAQRCVERLEKIALKPNPLSTKEYIDLMIESEKIQKLPDYQRRVEMLQNLKQKVMLFQAVRNNCPSSSGETMLEHFRNQSIDKSQS